MNDHAVIYLAPLLGLGGGLLPLVAGLEARFDLSPMLDFPLKVLALVIILAGYALRAYALIENRFFSGMVRIQNERGHHLVASGPYLWMRHPGYAGSLLVYLVAPAFLDSVWAYLPAVFLLIILVIRTSLEDRFLQDQLPGYQEYASRVRYRLVPGVW
jgi:protein-S-isoprenylcysteine O-methyltransferase Ste14